ncbi:FMRF-amide neuropeptides-like [Saccostrea cucullata]|uniref:FMRF-amide neuropeptides-like n=1 Tax=Saccostrea cuccullata TaxID=36930 RepID=UPI002ED4C449
MLRPGQIIIIGLFYLHNIKADIDQKTILHPVKTVESATKIQGENPTYSIKASDKRSSGFFRIGKSTSTEEKSDEKPKEDYKLEDDNEVEVGEYVPIDISLIPFAKSESGARFYVPVEIESPKDDNNPTEEEKRASGFFRIGKSNGNFGEKRNFFRIGKSLDQDTKHKKASGFFRIGRLSQNQNTKDKKASGFFRIGRTPDEVMDKRARGFFRIGKSSNDIDEKRASGFFRIGRSKVNDKRAQGFFRIGKSKGFFRIGKAVPTDGEKKASGFFRIGKDHPTGMNKKASGFFRIGKSVQGQANDKRASGFFRIGKSCSEDSKRAGRFFRIGKSHPDKNEEESSESQISSMSSTQNPDQQNKEKRAGRFFRIGKRAHGRITKRSSGDDVSAYEQMFPQENKRGYIRIGKVPASAFMRIGRQHFLQSLVSDPFYRNGRIQQSSFMRIGKRSVRNDDLEREQLSANSDDIL